MEQKRFEQNFLQYERLIYTICLQMVRDDAQAEDLVQETFLAAWLHRDRCAPGTEKSWLCRIAVNRAKDYLKSAYCRRVSPSQTLPEQPAQGGSLAELAEGREMVQRIEGQIDALRSPYREVSALYFLHSYTVPEIARLLQRPDKTVHTQLYRARALLKKGLCGAA